MPEGNPTPDRKRKGPPEGDSPEQGGDRGNKGGKESPSLRPPRGLFGFIAILTLGLLAVLMFTSVAEQGREVKWREFRNLYEQQELVADSIVLEESTIRARKRAGKVVGEVETVVVRISASTRDQWRNDLNTLTGGEFREAPTSVVTQMVVVMLWVLVPLLILMFFFFRGLRSAAGGAGGVLGNFGKSRHKVLVKEKTGITFADVAGIDEAKDEVEEIIEFLKHPKKFMRLGGRIPRGVLLVGDPGCGKTLLAKAIAGEADVPFFSISGSDFVEMFVGVGASRVRDLFKQAKESAPCIVFLDEIDAVGRRRGGGFTTGGHDEREQTLNAILVEMDGFNPSDGVIVIAATNRSDVLDPALIRPGRFDRQINVPLPDVKGRMEILRVHAKKVKLGPDVDLERLGKATPMFSGADLAAIINEAAIAATLQNKDWIEQEDLDEARDKVRFGRARKSRKADQEENRATAYHEAGHAILQALLKDADPLHKVTIIPRGQALGATFSIPEKDRYGYGMRWLKATMRVACGGRIAEQRITTDIASGAAMDIAQVTRLARLMVLDWGMSDKLGFVRYSGEDTRQSFVPEKDYSDETARVIDEEVRRYVDEAYADARRIIDENWEKVVAVADALLKHETLTADEVFRLMRGEGLGSKPTVSDLLSAEARKDRNVTDGAPALPNVPIPPAGPTRGPLPA
ncbi:MAG: ATP-dependent zinc metalloprotease FtsH [Phycisphaerales bacterium]